MGITVQHKVKGAEYTIERDYTKLLGEDWATKLALLLNSEYMNNLTFMIDQLYKQDLKTGHVLIPRSARDLFSPWKKTPYFETRVVFVTDEPLSYSSNGLGIGIYGNANSPIRCEELSMYHKNLKNQALLDENSLFDRSLESWAEQGVMCLNASLIKAAGVERQNSLFFKELTRSTLKALSDEMTDILFVFTTRKLAEEFKDCIDNDQYMLVYDGIDEDCRIFDDINTLLLELKETEIIW